MLRTRTCLTALIFLASSLIAQAEEKKAPPVPEPVKKEKADEGDTKSGSDLFENKKKAWAAGIHGGLPMLLGDIPMTRSLGFGFQIEKALGYSVGLRFHFTAGYMEGMHYQKMGPAGVSNNLGLNGTFNPNVNYTAAGLPMYMNFRNEFFLPSIDLVYHLNNISFLRENPRFSLYMFLGAGGMFYNVTIDALDANGNLYDYKFDATVGDDRASIEKKLREMRDFTFESQADAQKNATKYAGKYFQPIVRIGLGAQFKINDRLGIFAEGTYGATGTDLMDGQRWYAGGVPSNEQDAYSYLSLGLTFRLGRKENIYWFSNPLATPYKTILENKREGNKADRVGKEFENLKTQVDSNTARLDAMSQDTDGDGVADYWDQEDGSPAGAVVNPKGQTVFYKDNNGNLVYQDPSVAYGNATGNVANDQGSGNGGTNGKAGGNNSNAGNGDNSGNGGAGNYNGNGNNGNGGSGQGNKDMYTGTAGNGAPKTTFNPNSQQGRSVFMTNDGKGGLASPGTFSSVGYLPAIFFETNDFSVGKQYYPELFEVARILKQNPGLKIQVVGHADYRNTEGYNKNLGMQRAKAVSNALKTYFGVPESQLEIVSRGEMEPLANSKNIGALAANRRVQFDVGGGASTGPDGSVKTSAKPKKTEHKQLIDPATPSPNDFDQEIKEIINEPVKTEVRSSPKKSNELNATKKKGTEEKKTEPQKVDIFGDMDVPADDPAPTEQAEPVNASQPVKKAEPANVSQPVKKAEPANVSQPVKKTEPANAIQPVKKAEPVQTPAKTTTEPKPEPKPLDLLGGDEWQEEQPKKEVKKVSEPAMKKEEAAEKKKQAEEEKKKTEELKNKEEKKKVDILAPEKEAADDF